MSSMSSMPEPGSFPVAWFAVASTEPDVAHGILRETYTDFSVLLSGSTEGFSFAHSAVAAPRFAVGRLRYSMAAHMDASAPLDSLIISTRRGGDVGLGSGRDNVRPDVGQTVLMPPHTGWLVTITDVVQDSVVLDWAAVDEAARSLFGAEVSRPVFSSMTTVSPGADRYWNGLVDHLQRTVLADDEVAAQPLVMGQAVRSLATAVLTVFPNSALAGADGRADGPGDTAWAEPAVLRRALAYIDEHADQDIGVCEIAAAARVGVRALQYLFRRHRDRTPLGELRRVRLERAHRDLQDGDPTRGDTVAAIAARWGSTNPGRFSVTYRRVYGRSPSDTLRE